MTNRLLDTNAVSAAMKGSEIFRRFLRSVAEECLLLSSVIVEGEVRFGIARLSTGKKKRILTRALSDVLGSLHEIIPISRQVALRYAMVKNDLWSRGRPMNENDLWIASTALAHNTILVSHDSDFRSIRGLEVEDWTES